MHGRMRRAVELTRSGEHERTYVQAGDGSMHPSSRSSSGIARKRHWKWHPEPLSGTLILRSLHTRVAFCVAHAQEANKQVSADQFNFPGLGPPQASSRQFVYAASSSCGEALRGSSPLTPQTPAGIHSAPGVPSGGVLSGGLGGISAPSAVAQAVACALSSNDGLASIPEPRLTSATFSTAAAMTVAGLPVGAPAKAMELSMAAEAAAVKPAAVTCVATGCGSIMVAATAAVHAAQARAPSSMGSDADSGPHDQQQMQQMQQLQQELRRVPGARGHGPNGQREGEMDTRVMANVSPWTAATAVRAEDVELQCATDPSPPPDR